MSWLSEERRFTAGPVQVRAASGGGERIGGYAAVFTQSSQDLGGFIEQVAPTAFAKSKADGWPGVLCRLNHQDSDLLGTTRGHTLQLDTDATGLTYEVEPPAARSDVIELVRRGDIYRSSFAFQVSTGGDEWTLDHDGYPLRILRSVRLIDVAPVNTPAYEDATVAMRSLAQQVGAPVGEIQKLAVERKLRRLFTRSDRIPRPGARKVARTRDPVSARAELLARSAAAAARANLLTRSPGALRAELIGKRYDPHDGE